MPMLDGHVDRLESIAAWISAVAEGQGRLLEAVTKLVDPAGEKVRV